MNKQSDRATRSRNHQSPSGCVVSECTLSGCTISSHISLIFRRQNNHVSCHLTTQEMLTRQANKKVFWLCVNSYLLVIEFMNIIGSTNRGYIWGRGRGDERARASIVRNFDWLTLWTNHEVCIIRQAVHYRLRHPTDERKKITPQTEDTFERYVVSSLWTGEIGK